MTIKERLIELVRAEGYDFITACELVSSLVAELRYKKPGKYSYTIGATRFTIQKG